MKSERDFITFEGLNSGHFEIFMSWEVSFDVGFGYFRPEFSATNMDHYAVVGNDLFILAEWDKYERLGPNPRHGPSLDLYWRRIVTGEVGRVHLAFTRICEADAVVFGERSDLERVIVIFAELAEEGQDLREVVKTACELTGL